jgi:hypothetical protein
LWWGVKCGRAPTVWLGLSTSIFINSVRRCPTLPHPPGCSTIGAVGLSFRVRNGTGRFPHAVTAVTLVPVPLAVPGAGNLWLQHVRCKKSQRWCCYSVVVVLFPAATPCDTGLLSGNHIVDASSLVSSYRPWVQTPFEWVCGVVCGVSYRPISTGQLQQSLVLSSTSGLSTQWSGWGPLTHKVYGNLISKRASRLDAFSGYPIRT